MLQCSAASNGEKLFRLAISREAQFGSWYDWDFTPRGVNSTWTANWFDYPDMACTDANLFVTFNMFNGKAWQRAMVLRFPLATLATLASGARWATARGLPPPTARFACAAARVPR